jgi:predicted MFS family arabinose efflux permease
VIRVLRRRDFALLWTAGLVSVAGDWMLLAVLPYVVYDSTGSTVATAGMTVAELLPGILLGSVAGVWVDRWDLRRLLIVVNLAQAGVVSLLALTGQLGLLPVVYVVAVLQSALSAFGLPAETALLPALVPPEDLVPANALNALNNRIGRLAGLPVGAVVYAAADVGIVALVDAATFLGAAVLVSLLRQRPRHADGAEPAPSRSVRREWLAGLAVVRREAGIAPLFVVFGLMTFGGTMLDPLNAPWVRDVLQAGAGTFALLTACHSVSGIAGSLLVGAVGHRGAPHLLTGVGSIVAGLLLLVRFNVPVLAVAIALSLVGGVVAVASSVGVESLAQQRVPAAYRGRVFGSLQAVIWLFSLVGAAVGGLGAEVVGIVPMLDVAAALTVLAGVVVLRGLRPPETQQQPGG